MAAWSLVSCLWPQVFSGKRQYCTSVTRCSLISASCPAYLILPFDAI